jgi:hypothetical protein
MGLTLVNLTEQLNHKFPVSIVKSRRKEIMIQCIIVSDRVTTCLIQCEKALF